MSTEQEQEYPTLDQLIEQMQNPGKDETALSILASVIYDESQTSCETEWKNVHEHMQCYNDEYGDMDPDDVPEDVIAYDSVEGAHNISCAILEEYGGSYPSIEDMDQDDVELPPRGRTALTAYLSLNPDLMLDTLWDVDAHKDAHGMSLWDYIFENAEAGLS